MREVVQGETSVLNSEGRAAAIAELQRLFAEHRPEGAGLMSEELIAERRREAARELEA